jgi:hydroxyethylthiazole kinase-like sugar kinase family protein
MAAASWTGTAVAAGLACTLSVAGDVPAMLQARLAMRMAANAKKIGDLFFISSFNYWVLKVLFYLEQSRTLSVINTLNLTFTSAGRQTLLSGAAKDGLE